MTKAPKLILIRNLLCDCHPALSRPRSIRMVREIYHDVPSKEHPGELISIEITHCRLGLMAQLALLKNPKKPGRLEKKEA